MGELDLGVRGVTQFSELQTEQYSVRNSRYIRKLNEVGSNLGVLGKSVGIMNIDEFIKNDWNPEIHQPAGIKGRNDGSLIKSLQGQGSLRLSRTASEKIVDEVWREIQQEDKIKSSSQGMKREPSMGEMTLEDFLAKAEAIDESAIGPVMPLPLDMDATTQCFSQQIGLSPAPSFGGLSDTPILERKRDTSGTMDRGIEKRLKRKIKNRESAARSRARKQAYHNELVSKVSLLEEQNMRLKKEKELESSLPGEVSVEPRYQLRRTSSAIF